MSNAEPLPPNGTPARSFHSLRRLAARVYRPGPATLPRLILAVVPAILLVGIALSTVWGRHGLVTRSTLKADLTRHSAHLASLDRENQRLLRELSLMESDPVVLERMVAEELLLAREGATLYVFEPEKSPSKR